MAVDLSVLNNAVDFSTAGAAVLLVAAALVAVCVTWKAAKLVLGSLRGGGTWSNVQRLSDSECQRWFAETSAESRELNGVKCWQDMRNF